MDRPPSPPIQMGDQIENTVRNGLTEKIAIHGAEVAPNSIPDGLGELGF
jgi:hypothetical protein